MTDLSVTGNDRIAQGANHPPLSAFEAVKLPIDDLFQEAQVWLTGEGVTSPAEAEAVDTLLDLARKARKAADEARKAENEPFDTGKAEVQARYNPILKRADMIAETCKQVLQPFREKERLAKEAIAQTARKEADELRQRAEAAIRATDGNIAEREYAEVLLSSAKIAEKDASRSEKKAVTGNGLRLTYRADLVSLNTAIKHYWIKSPKDFADLVIAMAEADVRAGIRSIPGFDVIEERKAV